MRFETGCLTVKSSSAIGEALFVASSSGVIYLILFFYAVPYQRLNGPLSLVSSDQVLQNMTGVGIPNGSGGRVLNYHLPSRTSLSPST